MSRTVTVLGAAAAPVGKWRAGPGEQVLEHEVLADLVIRAVEDAGLTKEDVDGLVMTQPRPYTQQKYFATFMAHQLRLPTHGAVVEVLGNGMTGGLAFDQAANDVLLGRAKVTLALGVNYESGTSASDHMMSSMRAVGDVDFQAPFGITPIAWYAMDAARYMADTGATREQLGAVAVKNRAHAAHNPLAQYRTPITLDEVLAQQMIVEPLGLYDVPPRGDGAVCLVLAEEEVARSTGRPYARMRGRGFFHEGAHQISEVPGDMTRLVAAETAGAQALESAGITAADLDLAELYAPCTIVEILVTEALGLVPRGRGAAAAADGVTSLGGSIPVCTSGGLQSRGHPAYVTGLYTFVEALEQLRGRAGERQVRAAELALTCAELGNYNAAMVHVLEGVAA